MATGVKRVANKERRRRVDPLLEDVLVRVKNVENDSAIMRKWLVGDIDAVTGEPINGALGRLKAVEKFVAETKESADASRENSAATRSIARWALVSIVSACCPIVLEALFKWAPVGWRVVTHAGAVSAHTIH